MGFPAPRFLLAFVLASTTGWALAACEDDPLPADPGGGAVDAAPGLDAVADASSTPDADSGPVVTGEGMIGLSLVQAQTMFAFSLDRTKIWAWGDNTFGVMRREGQLFDHPVNVDIVGIPTGEPIRQVQTASGKTCILTEAGRMVCWGATSAQDSLGVGDDLEHPEATPLAQGDIPTGAKILTMGLNAFGGCVVADDGEAYCWGDFHRVPDLDDTIETVVVPHRIVRSAVAVGPIVDVATCINVSCTLAGGRAYCWFNGEPEPVLAGDLGLRTKLLQVRMNDDVGCATADDGDIYCWGGGFGHRFGNGSDEFQSDAPYTRVSRANLPAGVTFRDVAVGGIASASCGLGSDGWAYCWGDGGSGAAGDDDVTDHVVLSPTPIVRGEVPAGVTFVKLGCGTYHCVGEGSDHVMYSWGNNEDGALGAGVPPGTDVGHPIRVLSPRVE